MLRRPPRSCLHAVSSTVRWLCALLSFSHTNAILSCDKNTHVNTYLKNRPRGATQFALHNTYILQYPFVQTKLIHFIYNNSHYALCPQRILKPNGSFPWHCKKLSLQPQTIFTKENIPSLLITFFSIYIYSSWLNNFLYFHRVINMSHCDPIDPNVLTPLMPTVFIYSVVIWDLTCVGLHPPPPHTRQV
jgi:hypothetical protein